jgi:hypothetical protein
MGMGAAFASVSDATIERLLADPPLVWLVVAPDNPEAYERARQREADDAKPGFMSRLFGAKAPPPKPASAPLTLGDGEGDLGDIDKSWHGIHFLLTGSADEGNPPLDFLVGGGEMIGDEDVGYGPARAFRSTETKAIANALAALSDEELQRRFAPQQMMKAEVYPEIWDRDPSKDDTLGYLMEYVKVVREMLANVAARGHGLLVYHC